MEALRFLGTIMLSVTLVTLVLRLTGAQHQSGFSQSVKYKDHSITQICVL